MKRRGCFSHRRQSFVILSVSVHHTSVLKVFLVSTEVAPRVRPSPIVKVSPCPGSLTSRDGEPNVTPRTKLTYAGTHHTDAPKTHE